MMQHTIRRAYVDTPAGQVHYRFVAGAGTPLVLLHQTASSSAMYEALMNRLAGSRPLYAPDTPGFGMSDFPPQPPTVADYGQTLLAALDGLGVTHFHLFGHHTGAAIAVEMAVLAPERVQSLLLCGPVYMDAAERARWRELAVKPMIYQPDGSHLLWAWNKTVGARTPPNSLDVIHREAVETARAGNRWHEAYEAVFSQDGPVLFAQVRCPMLLLCAERDLLRPYFDAACAAHPEAKSVLLPGGGFVCDNDPDALVAAVQEFLSVSNEN